VDVVLKITVSFYHADLLCVMMFQCGFCGLWGSVLAFNTQVCRFKPGRSQQIFKGEKNPQHAFLRRESKAVGPVS
jgi:hypothetical protein